MNARYGRLSIVCTVICCLVGCATPPRASDSGQLATSLVVSVQTSGIDSSGGPLASSLNPVESSPETGVPSARETEPATGSGTVPVLPSATEIVPSAAVSSSVAESVPWPPIIIFGDILEAGTSEVVFGGISLQMPAGFSKTVGSDELLNYAAVRPSTGGTGSVSFRLTSSQTSDAGEQLKMLTGPAPSQVGIISIQGATSAAVGLSVEGDFQTWILGVITNQGLVIVRFSALSSDFDWFLFPQSVGSVQVQQ